MHAQNCLFRALECSNGAHSDLDKLMEALFFTRGRRPGLDAAGRGTAPSPGAGSPAQASAPSPAGGVGFSSKGRSPFSPAAGAGAAGAGGGTGSVVELISCPDSPPAGLVRTKPRCTLQAHNVAIEEAQHFRKISVKSVFGKVCSVWFRSDCRRDIINEVAVEDRCFGSKRLRRHHVGEDRC